MSDELPLPSGVLHMTAAILAGGASSRMGRDKAFIELCGVTLVERQIARMRSLFACVLIVANDAKRFAGLHVEVVPDEGGALAATEPRGPLGAISGAPRAAPTHHVFVCGVDMPFIAPALVRHMATLAPGFDAVVPETQADGRSHVEPLHAIYRKSCINALRSRLWSADRKVEHAIEGLRVRRVFDGEVRAHDPQGRSMVDIDTPEALAEAERLALAEEATPWRGSVRA